MAGDGEQFGAKQAPLTRLRETCSGIEGRSHERARDDSPAAAASGFARRVADAWDAALGPRLLGAYLIGSLAHGGFSARYSDIDMAVVAGDALAPGDLAAMHAAAADVSPALAPRLSLFWSDRAFAAGRFPPLDRIDYLDHAVRLIEREAVRPARPSRAEVRAYLGGSPFERWAARARDFAAADALAPAERKPYLRALLYPARFAYSWLTGTIASNDDAVAFLTADAPPGLDMDIIAAALACRADGARSRRPVRRARRAGGAGGGVRGADGGRGLTAKGT